MDEFEYESWNCTEPFTWHRNGSGEDFYTRLRASEKGEVYIGLLRLQQPKEGA